MSARRRAATDFARVVEAVADAISTHVRLLESQRRHWYAVPVGAGLHVPAVVDSVWPSVVEPLITGTTEYVGPVGPVHVPMRIEPMRVAQLVAPVDV